MARIRVCRWLLWLCLLAGWMGDKTGHVILGENPYGEMLTLTFFN